MDNITKEFNEFDEEFQKNENKENEINKLLKQAEDLVKVNEQLVNDSEKQKAQKKEQPKVEVIEDNPNTQNKKEIAEWQIEEWAIETAFKLSQGSPAISLRTLTLAELFKTIYIAGMKGD